jgi:RNA polymerase sigma-70 factor (ECF subfamily)
MRDGRRLRPLGDARLDQRPSPEHGPDALHERDQFTRTLMAHLERLPAGCRRVMTLELIEGLTHAEVAARIDITPRAAEKRAARGRKHLLRYLQRDGSGGLMWVSSFEDGGGVRRFVCLFR